MSVLLGQQRLVDATLHSDLFSHVVSVLSRARLVAAPFTVPPAKQGPAFAQQSPLGASRIVAQPEHFHKHIADAVQKASSFPPHATWDRAPADLKAAIKFVSAHLHDPAALIRKRKAVEGILNWAKSQLLPLSQRLALLAPEHVRSLPASINIAFVAALCRAIEWPDLLLPAKLLFGSPVVGDLPATGLFRPKERPASAPVSSFNRRAWADKLEKLMTKRGLRSTKRADADAAIVLAKSLDEVAGDWARGPFSREEMDKVHCPDGFWPARRFGVLQKGAIRPCDDCRENEQNDHSTTHESIAPDSAEFPATIAHMFYDMLGPACILAGGCDDWKKAYRQIPVDDISNSVVACWDPVKRVVVYFIVKGHVFGAVNAVNSFNAVSKFLTCAARAMFASCSGNYFDDHVVVEPVFASDSAQLGLACIATCAGFLFDEGKHTLMDPEFVYLGIQNDFRRAALGTVLLKILPVRRRTLLDICRSFLSNGRMTHGEASSLRGKLYFAATTAYGKVGRAALQPILQRQGGPSPQTRLTPALVMALKFFITLLNNMPDREIILSHLTRPSILVWSDASWEHGVGWLGFVVYDPELCRFFYSDSGVPQHVLDFFVRKKQKIGQAEILAACMVYTSMPDLFRGRSVIHWIDNTSAISCLLHGYSGKLDSALLVNAFHLFGAGLRVRIHFEYVESKANVADLPSRQEFTYLLLSLAAKRVPTIILPADSWTRPLRHFLFDALPGGPPAHKRGSRKRSRTPGHLRLKP